MENYRQSFTLKSENKNINHFYKSIELCSEYTNKHDMNSLRCSSIYINKLIMPKYFRTITINLNKVDILKFGQLVEKYNLYFKIYANDIDHLFRTLYPYTKNVSSVTFNNRNYRICLNDLRSLDFSSLLPSLEYLEIGENIYEPSIKEMFNNNINWPKNLKTLIFGHLPYSSPIEEGDLPPTLKCLKLYFFSGIIKENALPTTLKILNLDNCSNGLKTTLPLLEYLEFGCFFNESLNGVTEKSLAEYTPSLKCLKLGKCFDKELNNTALPSILETLILQGEYNHNFQKNVLPSSLQNLILSTKFSKSLSNVHSTLYSLELGDNLDERFNGVIIPKGLQKLTFGKHFNQKIKVGRLPESVTYLKFGEDFDSVINKNVLPKGLLHLEFGADFNQPIFDKSILPETIEYLKFGHNFCQRLCVELLPVGLKYLEVKQNILDDNYNKGVGGCKSFVLNEYVVNIVTERTSRTHRFIAGCDEKITYVYVGEKIVHF